MKKLFCVICLIFAAIACKKTNNDISVVSRESGSGTRAAFIELTGIEQKNESGGKTDRTTKDAIIANQTSIMINTVAGNPNAIGYISLGSLNNSVKALSIDGVKPSAENINNGSYKLARPFNIVLSTKYNPAAQDFVDFILSKDGQQVVSKDYISVNPNAPDFAGTKPSGKITVTGSSSISPVMEKLKEAYNKVNPNLTIEIQQNDSSTGMLSAMDGTCAIGMASRTLKEKELEVLTPVIIAIDGIAVIVNNNNTIENLSSEDVVNIFTGKRLEW